LAGKHCIITGASRGIGAEIARRFAREGARCLLIGRNESLLGKVREELEKVGEGEHRVLVGDVRDGEFWGLLKKEVSCVPFLWGDLGYVDFRGQNEC
jgi:NAD(P)-dependent dehydrogenase (short-subunit alcohol dehydrogenase family)